MTTGALGDVLEKNPESRTILMPEVAALVCGAGRAVVLSAAGELETMTLAAAAERAARAPFMVCYAPVVRRRLGLASLRAFDVLELFAFVRPARFCLPTPGGLAAALGLAPAGLSLEDEALGLLASARRLLAELGATTYRYREGAGRIAATLEHAGWPWGAAVTDALAMSGDEVAKDSGLDIWKALPDWNETAPSAPPSDYPVTPGEARERLEQLVGTHAEDRPGQRDYAARVSESLRPRRRAKAPNLVLAEAGTGVGKTLGYIAPASLWAERNGGAVWISTFTKNLQRQIDQELDRLYPEPDDKARKAVIRKGRENYLCLLNFRDAVDRATLSAGPAGPAETIALGLVARWARFSRDGDMVGGDFPAYLAASLGPARLGALTDRRGECIYSACDHYRKCFIERAVRKARNAEIVVANHALVMVLAALGNDGADMPARIVFDEGHHLFSAADGAFSSHLSGRETAELRRWVRGAEGRRGGRARGLERRIGDLVEGDGEAYPLLRRAAEAAARLPGEGWLARISSAAPQGPAERFFILIRDHIYARARRQGDGYSLEADINDPSPRLIAAAAEFGDALAAIAQPLAELARALARRLDDEAGDLETAVRVRIEAAVRGLTRRTRLTLASWTAMLDELAAVTPEPFVDWFSLDRIDGREIDVGLHRHWIDPTRPFAETVLEPAHGVIVTSATLRDTAPPTPPSAAGDNAGDDFDDWASAEMRTGALHMIEPATRVSVSSPFDYPRQTRVIVVTDVRRDDSAQVAAAYRELFIAAGGGGLGLFTAIARLRQVHGRIVHPLDDAGIPLYAQHVDAFDTGTLVDIFRAEERSCLLGTDAVRDGVDVPGRSLRLIVFERVPWPRPDILHRARRKAFGERRYDDMLTRLKLKQAYGRLIRRQDDIGVFVMLDAAMPSRLAPAFPDGVAVARMGLAETLAAVRDFLGDAGGQSQERA